MTSRRTFLARAAGGAALAAAAIPAARAQTSSPKPRQLRKGIMFATVGIKGASVGEKFQAIKEAGFEGVEPMGGMDQDEVMKALDATGLKAASVCCHTHWAKPLSHPSRDVRSVGLEGLKQSLKDAKKYGATSVLLVPAVVNKEIAYDDAWVRSQREIRRALDLAEDLEVFISIENVWNNFLLSPMEAARYVDELNSDFVGWHFDVGNIIYYGWPEQWIKTLGPRIQRLHIKEFSRSKADKEGRGAGFRVEFLKGDNDWPTVMKALGAINYSGWGIAEQPGADSAEGLKKLSTEMDQIFAG